MCSGGGEGLPPANSMQSMNAPAPAAAATAAETRRRLSPWWRTCGGAALLIQRKGLIKPPLLHKEFSQGDVGAPVLRIEGHAPVGRGRGRGRGSGMVRCMCACMQAGRQNQLGFIRRQVAATRPRSMKFDTARGLPEALAPTCAETPPLLSSCGCGHAADASCWRSVASGVRGTAEGQCMARNECSGQ